MDIEELKARMKETKLDVNHDNSNESASRSYLGAEIQHATTRVHPQINSETPSRRPEEGLYVSSPSFSSRRIRRSHAPKRYNRPISHLSGDASESIPASSSASSSLSRDSWDGVHGRLLSAPSIVATPRRTAERGSRRGLPSRRGCLL
jgi:hypothetical protein